MKLEIDRSASVLVRNSLFSTIAGTLLAVSISVGALAQNAAPGSAPLVPDSRKPGRTIQPDPSSASAPASPKAAATSWASEARFSQSTLFSFEMQPANHPRMTDVDTLIQTEVTLYKTDTADGASYSGNPALGGTKVTLSLSALSKTSGSLTDSARVAIQNALIAKVNAAGIGGVACLIDPATSAQGINKVKLVVAQVGSVRTVGSGVRADEGAQVVDDNKHGMIKKGSPIQPGDLLEKEVLEDYLYSLSRFPGRSVSAAITTEPSSAQVVLDYYVQEKNVFDVYFSVSNTGTEETNLWQERIGILATQLSNNDDILTIEYQTSSFDDTYSVNGYYDARVGKLEDLRWRFTGLWSQYNSSNVGLASEDFNGSSWSVQGDLIWTFFQKGNFFLDLDAAARAWNSRTQGVTGGALFQDGSANFFTGSGTVDALAVGDTWALQGSVGAMYTSTGATQQELDDLGRANTSTNWTTINASLYGSFYLDPYLDASWGTTALNKTLVHEIFGSIRGQYAFDYRLTPLSQFTMGGLYTVRGYEMSIDAGDNAFVGTVEYRLHLPRMFNAKAPSGENGPWMNRPFRWAPDSGTGAGPDWDLVLSGFFDGGSVSNNDAFAFETNTPMCSAGVGLDLTILENIAIGVDWGWALTTIEELGVNSGSTQFWFSASIVY